MTSYFVEDLATIKEMIGTTNSEQSFKYGVSQSNVMGLTQQIDKVLDTNMEIQNNLEKLLSESSAENIQNVQFTYNLLSAEDQRIEILTNQVTSLEDLSKSKNEISLKQIGNNFDTVMNIIQKVAASSGGSINSQASLLSLSASDSKSLDSNTNFLEITTESNGFQKDLNGEISQLIKILNERKENEIQQQNEIIENYKNFKTQLSDDLSFVSQSRMSLNSRRTKVQKLLTESSNYLTTLQKQFQDLSNRVDQIKDLEFNLGNINIQRSRANSLLQQKISKSLTFMKLLQVKQTMAKSVV
eukprot:c19345_g2_i1.p1 GENE.c19345_g2_i1~~c19345_g2_i1.p1  ORF type:complete len:300 (+),score=105.86 c19345_g2_i1:478-1377(+)